MQMSQSMLLQMLEMEQKKSREWCEDEEAFLWLMNKSIAIYFIRKEYKCQHFCLPRPFKDQKYIHLKVKHGSNWNGSNSHCAL